MMAKNLSTSTFCKYVVKMYKQLYKLDQQKHLEPYFSNSIKQLIVFIIRNKHQLLDKNGMSHATKVKEGSFMSRTGSDD